MVEAIAFQARARTVDHLGREQIADCPTAISELWKNSFDAYARSVHLHVLDGEIYTATLVDDGHGMSKEELLNKWLVLGTESKVSGADVPKIDQGGLPLRRRQGQKGIGRLSAAALGPLMLLISKRESSLFVAALVDWRLFENPFLFLDDIKIPVVEFASTSDLLPLVDKMFDRLMGNIWGDNDDLSRKARLERAWDDFEKLEKAENKHSTRAAIEAVLLKASITERQLNHWAVWQGQRPHGTAMIIADISFDLRVLIPGLLETADESIAEIARSRLKNTLDNFTDPYAGKINQQGASLLPESLESQANGISVDFTFGVTAWRGALNTPVVSDARAFGLKNLAALEHIVDGWVDAAGVFHGKIKAFGKWLDGEILIQPEAPIKARSDSRVGAFGIRLATFEQQPKSSTHDAGAHSFLSDRVNQNAGFFIFRNGLRIMPYGREDNDFFEIERRRGMHAGREFWSIRRIFGRVALTIEENPNLKDKAGREGFIDNKAAKVFRDLVENVLRVTAHRYFGSDSSIRKNIIPGLKADFERQRAEEARKKLSLKRRKDFRKNLDQFLPDIISISSELECIANEAKADRLPNDEDGLLTLRSKVESLKERQSQLTLGAPPAKLGALERNFKEFRSAMNRSSEIIGQLRDSISVAIDKVKPRSQSDLAHSQLNRNASYLNARVRKWALECKQLLAAESQRLAEVIDTRNKSYYASTLPLLGELEASRFSLSDVLRRLDDEKEVQDQENTRIFQSYLSTLQALAENIDLEGLVSFTLAENATNREEIQRLNALAQLGITVEIVSHEVSGFEYAISSGLAQLPEEIKLVSAYQTVKHSFDSLSERLRFLAPLKLSGERAGQWIKGTEIADFVANLLQSLLISNNVKLQHTEAFDRFSVFDQFARIMPIFVNLVNNAIYWTGRSEQNDKVVLLDVYKNVVFVSDNGPGVDSEDIPSLFSLFFTKKIRGGRGVGLYLCRANLAAAGHTIQYSVDENMKRLNGANFIMVFSGANYA